MKKLVIFLVCLFLYKIGYTSLLPPECPKEEVICGKNEFPGDDGKCYSCDIDKGISTDCIGWQKMKRLCPNRIGYGISYLNCPDNMEELHGNCVDKCKDGYTREGDGLGCCKKIDDRTTECYLPAIA